MNQSQSIGKAEGSQFFLWEFSVDIDDGRRHPAFYVMWLPSANQVVCLHPGNDYMLSFPVEVLQSIIFAQPFFI